MLLQRCFANVETTSINVHRLNFHFQPNINVDERWRSTLFQRWFNVDVFTGIQCLHLWRFYRKYCIVINYKEFYKQERLFLIICSKYRNAEILVLNYLDISFPQTFLLLKAGWKDWHLLHLPHQLYNYNLVKVLNMDLMWPIVTKKLKQKYKQFLVTCLPVLLLEFFKDQKRCLF